MILICYSLVAGGKSILSNVAATGIKSPFIVRQVSAQGQLGSASGLVVPARAQSSIVRLPLTTASGEIPKRIEQSELSPSMELDIENDT